MKSGRRVIALIEDDPLVRVPLAQGLDGAGYFVIGAATGPEALALLEDADIDLALVDIKLPGRLDGLGVIRAALRTNPKLRAILMSGQRPSEDVSAMGPFITKPFRLPDLLALVADVIGKPSAS